jgi:hypothetical protein
MTVCVESCIGAEGGRQGVKLEQQVVIGEGGSYRSPVAASRRTGVELHRVETSRSYGLRHAQSEPTACASSRRVHAPRFHRAIRPPPMFPSPNEAHASRSAPTVRTKAH